MTDPTNDRKLEHLRIIAGDPAVERSGGWFDRVHLTHRALPEVNRDAIDLSSPPLAGKTLRAPLLISSMTGSGHGAVRDLNHRLAEAAEARGIALAVGSQRVQFTEPEARASFALRDSAPTTLLVANLGAVQLNLGFGADQARAAVEVLGADALYLHLNPLQEAVQPEGDTCFAGLADRIGEIARELKVPVWIKEVGAGLSSQDVALLYERGLRVFDVAGRGGTSWSRIEGHRAGDPAAEDNPGMLFQDWGLPTPVALQALARFRENGATLIASGGIRNGIDVAKALVLGASLAGLARPFLAPGQAGTEEVVAVIDRLCAELRTALFLLGAASVSDVIGREDLLLGV